MIAHYPTIVSLNQSYTYSQIKSFYASFIIELSQDNMLLDSNPLTLWHPLAHSGILGSAFPPPCSHYIISGAHNYIHFSLIANIITLIDSIQNKASTFLCLLVNLLLRYSLSYSNPMLDFYIYLILMSSECNQLIIAFKD